MWNGVKTENKLISDTRSLRIAISPDWKKNWIRVIGEERSWTSDWRFLYYSVAGKSKYDFLLLATFVVDEGGEDSHSL